ncbi:Monooxygenase FAD-binding [Penicillium expansum]|nr:Monooxygenase FAD-binding [Penicillium expansum]
MITEDCIEFKKEAIAVTEGGYGGNKDAKTILHFGDDTVAEADIVLGCDGLRSKVRQLILGVDNPASQPSYSHKVAFRGLVPMQKAREVLGENKSSTGYMHLGQNGHFLTFPVAMGTILNVVAFVTDPGQWPSNERLTLPATKDEAVRYFSGFCPVVISIMEMLDERLDKWGIFNLFDNPATSYVSEAGLIGLIGDAAHASAPHHGASAGCAIEDALALAVVLEDAAAMLQESSDAVAERNVGIASCPLYLPRYTSRTYPMGCAEQSVHW